MGDKSLPTSDPQNLVEDAKVEPMDSMMDIIDVAVGLTVEAATKMVSALESNANRLVLRIVGRDPSPPKAPSPKILQKRKVEATSGKSTHARVELLPTPPTSEIEEFNPHSIEDFQVVWAPHDSDPPAPEGSHGTSVFLSELAHYLNEFMKNTVDLSTKASRFELEASMLKMIKDKLSKTVGKASNRADAAEKEAQDAEAALKRSIKENARLLGINKALVTEVEELKTQSTNTKASEAEALTMVKMAKEKMAMLMCDMEARVEVAISKAVDNFRVSEEFKNEKVLFALDVYDEEKCIVWDEVASRFSRLDLSFLDEVLRAFAANPKNTP
ncbi:hypothetical protein COCNU_01G018140 [Cocos nucifera]|uniref:Uncharacterized protein n=1 Tax=Cocos nucifera TaxID=13894 RepID=A0A8K0MVX0_COCNU|nr:hypothetical protein COCNU_01G018140 [Cocos nucifera]